MSKSIAVRLGMVVTLGGSLFNAPAGAGGLPNRAFDGREVTAAATAGETVAPDHFGLDQQYTTFGIGAFTAQSSLLGHGYKNNGYIYPSTLSTLEWIAELGPATGVPMGASVVQVCAYVFDSSGANQISLSVGAYEFGSASDNPSYQELGLAATGVAETPGYASICTSPADLTVRSYMDFAGDASEFYGYHRVGIKMGGNTSDIAFAGVLVRWQRQLSPVPVSPTFGDVPTNHPFFQYVEALVASGVTAGCGAGNYCPDVPLTRGQMAVFLAKALGLYWPY